MLAVGAGLAMPIVRSAARLDRRIDRTNDRIDELKTSLRTELATRTDQLVSFLRTELGSRIDRLEQGQADLRERMAKLEGPLEGLREAITGRRVA